MSHTAESSGSTAAGPSTGGVEPTPVSGWAGWIAFAAAVMLLLGVFHAIAGLVALFRDEYYVVGNEGLVLTIDYTGWGWIHLLGGGVMCAAGLGLLVGQMWARVIAVILAMLSAVTNLVFLAANPFWAMIMIGLALLVVWAVMVHGGEMRDA